MGLTAIQPADFKMLSVESSTQITDETGKVDICTVNYEFAGREHQAKITFFCENGALRVSTLGHSVEIYTGQILGGLLARVSDINPGVVHAQTH